MKRIFVISAMLGVMFATGCQQPAPVPAPTPNIHVEVHPQVPTPVPPPLPPQAPPVPPSPTRNYIFGYQDGYSNRLVSIRWSIWEYRKGWELGRWERAHGMPHRFPR